MAVLGYLDDVEVAELAGIDGEADEGTHLMPALQPCGTGVDMKEAELAVELYLEDMAVAADEELGWTGEELVADTPVVAPGIAADMGHEDVGTLACPSQLLREHQPQVGTVAVADDSTQGTESGEAVGEFHGTDVAGMPYLVALGEILQVLIVPVGVGVGKKADAFQVKSERVKSEK